MATPPAALDGYLDTRIELEDERSRMLRFQRTNPIGHARYIDARERMDRVLQTFQEMCSAAHHGTLADLTRATDKFRALDYIGAMVNMQIAQGFYLRFVELDSPSIRVNGVRLKQDT